MKNINPLSLSSLLSLGVIAYVILVATVMHHGNNWFGREDTWATPIAVLMLFTISAAIVGGLVLGYPAYLFFSGQKRASLTTLGYTISFLVAATILIFIGLAVTS